MYRDFTEDEKQKLLGYVQDDEDKNSGRFAGGVIDFFADIAHYSDLDINDYVNNIDDYHKKLIDAEDMTAEKIEAIFEAVHDVDDDTLTNIDIVRGLIESLQRSFDSLKANIQIGNYEGTTKPLALPTEDYTEKIGNEVSVTDAKTCAEVYNAYRDGDIEKVQEYLDSEVDELSRDVTAFGNQYTRTDLKVREEMVVDFYRLIDPDSADGFDELFDSCNDTISEFDRYNIMYIVYTADEPYRSVYLDSLGTYTLGDFNSSVKPNQFRPGENTVNVNTDNGMFSDVKGPYTTFFHECGHAIDYNFLGDNYYSVQYDFGQNTDIIIADVYSNIEDSINDYIDDDPVLSTLSDDDKAAYCQHVIECIQNGGDRSYLTNTDEEQIYDDIVTQYDTELSAEGTSITLSNGNGAKVRAGISDIYGGATNNVINGDRGHYDTNDSGEYTYWFDSNGNPTQNQSSEMFAHYYSYGITGNDEAMDDMRDYLPNTMTQYDEMIDAMDQIGF